MTTLARALPGVPWLMPAPGVPVALFTAGERVGVRPAVAGVDVEGAVVQGTVFKHVVPSRRESLLPVFFKGVVSTVCAEESVLRGDLHALAGGVG